MIPETIKSDGICPKCGGEMLQEPQRPGVLKCSLCHSIRFMLRKPGDIEGEYCLLETIGHSGMHELFRCRLRNSPSPHFAMKILPISSKSNLFERESKDLFRIRHKNIVQFFDRWHDQNSVFVIMEYIHGKTLEQIKKEGHVFSEKSVMETALATAEALCYLWEKWNLVHRDVNPSNIMVDDKQQIRLIDLGIAATPDQLREDPGIDLGTPGYLSPEQFKSPREVTFTSDIFSLGATMYFLLTGRPPYMKNSVTGSFRQILSGEIFPVKALNPDVSDESAALIERMLHTDPEKRPRNWRILMEDIKENIS